MIELTRLNGSRFTINAELIETMESAAKSTVICLATNNRYNVQETVDVIVEKVIEYRKRINTTANAISPIQGFERESKR